MYLHDAMILVLSKRPEHAASTTELSEEIERRGLYDRKDGDAADASQVNARAHKHPELFEIDSSGIVRLKPDPELKEAMERSSQRTLEAMTIAAREKKAYN